MAPKRSADIAEHSQKSRERKKPKMGFTVGPANLPDGTYRRKVQKIKQNLIRNAKVKTSYRKLREREQLNTPKPIYNPLNAQDEEPSSLELHPDRQVMLEESASVPPPQSQSKEARSSHPRQKRPKPQPFKRETQLAQERKEEREARQKEIEENNRKRQVKIEERERFRKAMAKARSGGRNGQRKLGRESKVLLEKVRRIVDK